MRILIATAGELAPEPVADFVESLGSTDHPTCVITVIEVPRSFLKQIRSEGWNPLSGDPDPIGEDEIIRRYVDERGRRITEPMVAALEHRGIPVETLFVEGSDAATAITDTARGMGSDLVVVGVTKRLFDESSWESVTGRVIRESGCPVLVVPSAPREDTGEFEVPDLRVEHG